MLPDDDGSGVGGGSGIDEGALDEVIVIKRPDSFIRHSANRTKSGSPNNKKDSLRRAAGGSTGHKRSCRCQHGAKGRQRHNATQTPDSVLSCSRQIHSCHRHNTALDCCNNTHSNSCCGLINGDLKTGEITCHCHITHHCHRYSPASGSEGVAGVGVSGDGREQKSCESCGHNSCSYQQRHTYQRHHHLHHHRRNNQHHHNHNYHHHHHHYRHLQPAESQTANAAFNIRQLPGYNSKSSFDSSDDLQLSAKAAGQREHLQEIEIEIDAATMTEGNTSTATSNFAYKMAKGNVHAAPIIMAPLHDHWEEGRNKSRQKRSTMHRCDSTISRSTAETDELSRGNRGEQNDGEIATNNSLINGPNKNAHHTLWGSRDINDLYKTNSIRTELTKTDNVHICDGIAIPQKATTPQLICCDDSMCCGASGLVDVSNKQRSGVTAAMAYNECVKIRRKLFKASEGTLDDCCSTCSHCSNCSCQQNADVTSCSSFDDLDADDDDDDYAGPRRHKMAAPHELVVAAECHRCYLQQRRSTSSTGGEEVDEVDVEDEGVGDDDDEAEDKLTGKLPRQLSLSSKRILHRNNTTDSSAHTSRRSSTSYCSCHSSTCFCCECNCRGDADGHDGAEADDDDDCDTATTDQMRTARDTSFTTPFTASAAAAADFDAEHSSTLTPLTNLSSSVVSTPGAEEADITLRSFNNTLTEDIAGGGSSSLSQSAEYFSLSSNNQLISQHTSPADTPVHRQKHKLLHSVGGSSAGIKRHCNLVESTGEVEDENIVGACVDEVEVAATSRKPCKHYSKHHRHKRSQSPLDGYL